MTQPRFQRRKEDRPDEIAEAALAAFAENGYAGTRVDDVARRAGVSKGLLYLYFKTKEDLFKAVVRNFVAPKVDELRQKVATSELSAEAFLRGPFLTLIKTLPASPVQIIVRLMVAEGPKHPDLTEFYCQNVVRPGMETLRQLIRKGVASGEFQPNAVEAFPQLLISPVLFSVFWKIVFDRHLKLDTDALLDAHIDAMILFMKSPDTGVSMKSPGTDVNQKSAGAGGGKK